MRRQRRRNHEWAEGWFHYYKRYVKNDVGKGGVRGYEAYQVQMKGGAR